MAKEIPGRGVSQHVSPSTRSRRRPVADRAPAELVLHLTGIESDADDITQEVFLGAYRSIGQFAGRSEFKSFFG